MDTDYSSAPERGARRRKLAGYLKAANELRQSYQQSYGLGGQRDGTTNEDGNHMPGAFPDPTVSRSGDEEMLLFPSYAVRHAVRKGHPRDLPGATQDIRSNKGTGDAEYWHRQWEKYEDQNAVVDVDVRGWIYSPHRGQMTRKNRLLVGIARQLSGLPAPSSSRTSSPSSPHHARVETRKARQEEELVEKEAESITLRGQGEANIAWRGGYSEAPGLDEDDTNGSSKSSSPDYSRPASPEKWNARAGGMARPISNSSLRSEQYDSGTKAFSKRTSWNQPSEMNSAELNAANAHMMVRLKPFLSSPLVSTNLTVFFYNDSNSVSRTITTNEAGHFSLRAALDFVPTNVRVLASVKLSATAEIHISEPTGVSMISDIDDTIKHSGIGSGAREIFRNAFIRDLGDLMIDGVKEWYSTMADLGVKFHYVSNSPWQLYPVLVSYFAQAGLPKGSFHLKQYNGMLQGIFEPVAERKKGTLERILSDFPERRFILAGDSGEADLELYTDVVLANPGRILGVFIRDVTTSKPPAFFDSSMKPMRSRGSQSPLRGRSKDDSGIPLKNQFDQKPPTLPPRQASHSANTPSSETNGPTMGTLIDFDDEPTPGIHHSMTDPSVTEAQRKLSTTSIKSLPPSRPSKPKALRSISGAEVPSSSHPPPYSLPQKPAAPPPNPKPRQYSTSQENPSQPNEPSPLCQTQNVSPPGSRSSSLERQSYRSAVRNKVASAYNALPSLYSTSPYASQHSTPDPSKPQPNSRPPPPVPPRRNITSYPAAAAHYATNRLSGGWSGYANDGGSGSSDDANGNEQVLSKKEEMWMRRWARAKEIFDDKGVVLRAWRVGEDVADEAVRLVEGAGRGADMKREKGRR
ncbi:hypothetical protein IMSHALPRED_006840 [Imshaugia aleurites]|uniref:Phosphatidate phosphatase APP1 catalytic domain-containing protein n=1 Tax=Imshaugia aleurites TaxID=172621 RepID=A0A8H3FHD2_9LECA|nr:hypothetical protein IMSHALPRED_006840 [Imshaugia aleurites]